MLSAVRSPRVRARFGLGSWFDFNQMRLYDDLASWWTLLSAPEDYEVVSDLHLEGLFPRETWLRLLADAGLAAEVASFDHSELKPGSYQIFVARKLA